MGVRESERREGGNEGWRKWEARQVKDGREGRRWEERNWELREAGDGGEMETKTYFFPRRVALEQSGH